MPIPDTHCINAYDVLRKADLGKVFTAGDAGWRVWWYEGNESKQSKKSWRTFAEAVAEAAPKVTEWATVTGSQYAYGMWFPAAVASKVDGLVWHRDSGKTPPVKVHVGWPCEGYGYTSGICGRPSIERDAIPYHLNTRFDEAPKMVAACKRHLGLHVKNVERRERWDRESQERTEKWKRQEELSKASRDWAARLFDEFGLTARACGNESEHLLVKMSPEELYAALVEAVTYYREFEIDDHLLRPKEQT